jgi:outer membrane receptor protein involved in Fe transport
LAKSRSAHREDRLTLGYRYHDQSSDQYNYDLDAGVVAGTWHLPVGPNIEFSGSPYDGIRAPGAPTHVAFDADTYRVAGSWHLTDDVMRCRLLGGFNWAASGLFGQLGIRRVEIRPETIENTEIGIRTDLANGRLRLNATLFSTDWVDIQLLATIKDRRWVERSRSRDPNAASATAEGLEVELTWA